MSLVFFSSLLYLNNFDIVGSMGMMMFTKNSLFYGRLVMYLQIICEAGFGHWNPKICRTQVRQKCICSTLRNYYFYYSLSWALLLKMDTNPKHGALAVAIFYTVSQSEQFYMVFFIFFDIIWLTISCLLKICIIAVWGIIFYAYNPWNGDTCKLIT